MKTRSHLLLLMLVLVLVVVCFAACNMTNPPADTTAPTTTAPTTTAPTTPPVGNLHPHAQNISVAISGSNYTGKPLNGGYTVKDRGNKIVATWSFQQIDPATGEPLSGVAPVEKPVEVGTYDATVSFSFIPAATAEDRAYDLPDPVTGRYVVEKKTLGDNELNVSAQGFKTFWHEGMALDLGDTDDSVSRVAAGNLPEYLERVYTVYKVDDATGANPVLVDGTVVTDGGFYKVVITYREPAGRDNVTNEGDAKFRHEAIVDVEYIGDDYQVLKAENIVIDGFIDSAYYASAKMSSAPETWTEKNAASAKPSVNYKENIGMVEVPEARGSKVTETPNTSLTLYVLWGEEEVTVEGKTETWPFLYVAAEVYDETILPRSAAYTAHRNAWVNDSLEFSYNLGGYDIPVIPKGENTYPTYNTVLVDAREKDAADHAASPNHTAVMAQKSHYFNYIQSATKHVGENRYVMEMKIPARKESYSGTPGNNFERFGGDALQAGEFLFFCVQLNDLTGLPEGYDSIKAYDAKIPEGDKYDDELALIPADKAWRDFEDNLAKYMYSSGNRRASYLSLEGNGPTMFQLSSDTYDVTIDVDGEKDDDYAAKGTPVNVDGADCVAVAFENNLYIYTTVADATTTDVVWYYIGDDITFFVDADGELTMIDGDASIVTVEKAATGYAHEVKVALDGVTVNDLSVELYEAQ